MVHIMKICLFLHLSAFNWVLGAYQPRKCEKEQPNNFLVSLFLQACEMSASDFAPPVP